MAKQSVQTIRMGLMVFSLFALVACSSTSDTDTGTTDDEGPSASSSADSSADSSNSVSDARTSPGSTAGQLTQEEIRAENALRQTVFYFDFDMAEFNTADRETLSFHARELAANPDKRLRLEGHADERGTREYNLALGERRANSILNYLIVSGAARSQIEVVSYGEERPAQTGQSENAYGRNRRVEIASQ